MKPTFRIICVSLLVLCALPLRAETITHVFNTDVASFGKVNNIANKQATMKDGLVYTCGTSSAVFGQETYHAVGERVIVISVPKDGVVTTTTAIEDLTRLTVKYYTTSSYDKSYLKLYISEDGSFGDVPVPETRGSRTPFSTSVAIDQEFDLPKGDYYIKLVNEALFAYEISIFQIEYKTDPSSCACLQVVSQ